MVQRKMLSGLFSQLADKSSGFEKSKKQRIAQFLDAVFVCMALGIANLLRLSAVDLSQLWPVFLLLPFVTVLLFQRMGVYNMVIRFSGMDELAPLMKGVVMSSILLLVVQHLVAPDPNPRSIFIIYGLVLVFFCAGARHLWKWLASDAKNVAGEPIAIYGAGALGRQVMQICRSGLDYRPVVWLDDDKKMHGRVLSKAKVFDPKDPATPDALKRLGIETILMAIPSVSSGHMKQLLESLRNFDCRVQTLPSIDDIMANRVTTRDAKTLPLEELIGRQQVAPDMDLMCKNVTGKVVMVTGAGGSVGSELCRQILPLKPTALILFDVSEAALYQIESDLKLLCKQSGSIPVHCILGNVIFKDEIKHTVGTYAVQTLFHAAAYKHVPMVESNPQPAIRTNIFGSLSAVEAAIEHQVENFLLISTDKAVRPTNVMGATKRVAEMVVQAKAALGNGATQFSIVRFGNVIGSSGSVVPKFSEQIESGGPVTVTHEHIVRYFMSIPEAAQLVIQASSLCKGGDVFLLDMGQPVQIADLAKSLVYLHGKTLKDEDNPKGEIEILYTGLREGEKLYEELLIDETAQATAHPKISRAKEGFIEWPELNQVLQQFEAAMKANPDDEMVEQLRSVVIGYKPNRFARPKVVPICDKTTVPELVD
ncbi:hypothetical protein AB833_25895 [Chromatiales bacterium (ex Bugula neritina AB1)]|nr:hypothetical protein AB833_25895 [Chromatiales bacterium (ex Bugula neritina AB1)]